MDSGLSLALDRAGGIFVEHFPREKKTRFVVRQDQRDAFGKINKCYFDRAPLFWAGDYYEIYDYNIIGADECAHEFVAKQWDPTRARPPGPLAKLAAPNIAKTDPRVQALEEAGDFWDVIDETRTLYGTGLRGRL